MSDATKGLLVGLSCFVAFAGPFSLLVLAIGAMAVGSSDLERLGFYAIAFAIVGLYGLPCALLGFSVSRRKWWLAAIALALVIGWWTFWIDVYDPNS